MKSLKRRHYPVKTYVNLFRKEKKGPSVLHIIMLLALLAVLAVFGKFAIVDRFAAADAARLDAENAEKVLADMIQNNADYDDVMREYRHYYFSAEDGLNGTVQNYVNCQDVLNFLDKEFVNKAGVQMVHLAGNVLTVNLTEINLEEASVIADSLMKNEMAADVLVSYANKHDGSQTSVFLTVTLRTEKGVEGEVK